MHRDLRREPYRPVRAGIVGCGRIVQDGHVAAFQELSELVHVVAVADPVQECRDRVGGALGVEPDRRYDSHTALLEAENDLDFVDLALPHFLHARITIDCARAGLNILTEKPMATSVGEADAILAAVEGSGSIYGVIHNYRYSSVYQTFMGLIRDGAIGEPYLIRSEGIGTSHYPGTQSYDPDWRTKSDRGVGGCLLDNGYHNLYTIREAMGSPVKSVYGRVGTYLHPITVDDVACVLLEHENGGTTSIQIAWGTVGGGRGVHEYHGTEGSIWVGYDDHPLALCRKGEWSYPEMVTLKHQGFAGYFLDYLEALVSGGDPPTDGEEARENLRVVEAAYESAKTGEVVHLM